MSEFDPEFEKACNKLLEHVGPLVKEAFGEFDVISYPVVVLGSTRHFHLFSCERFAPFQLALSSTLEWQFKEGDEAIKKQDSLTSLINGPQKGDCVLLRSVFAVFDSDAGKTQNTETIPGTLVGSKKLQFKNDTFVKENHENLISFLSKIRDSLFDKSIFPRYFSLNQGG